jgi:hypothetical protein
MKGGENRTISFWALKSTFAKNHLHDQISKPGGCKWLRELQEQFLNSGNSRLQVGAFSGYLPKKDSRWIPGLMSSKLLINELRTQKLLN